MRRYEIEQGAGAPLAPPIDPVGTEKYRKEIYQSYENFLRKRLEAIERHRPKEWHRNYSTLGSYAKSVRSMRNRLKSMVGFWIDPRNRLPLKPRDFEILLKTKEFTVRRFRFEALPGLETYAVEVIPAGNRPRPGLLIQHGYTGTPELACGFTPNSNAADYSYRSMGIRAARRGFHVVAVYHPSGYGNIEETVGTVRGFEGHGPTYGKNRLHRLALMGEGTLVGLDLMASSRGLDFLEQCSNVIPGRIGMYGLSQGGLSTLYLAALDKRLRASVVSAYFNTRFLKLVGPHRTPCYLDSFEEEKFFGKGVRWFSDADIVSLIAPRAFAVEAGEKDLSVDFEKAEAEFKRAAIHYKKLGIPHQIEFIPHVEGHVPVTRRAFDFLEEKLC